MRDTSFHKNTSKNPSTLIINGLTLKVVHCAEQSVQWAEQIVQCAEQEASKKRIASGVANGAASAAEEEFFQLFSASELICKNGGDRSQKMTRTSLAEHLISQKTQAKKPITLIINGLTFKVVQCAEQSVQWAEQIVQCAEQEASKNA